MSEQGKILEFRPRPPKPDDLAKKREEEKESEEELLRESYFQDPELVEIENEHLDIDEQWGRLRDKVNELNLKSSRKKLEQVTEESIVRVVERSEPAKELEDCEERLDRLIEKTKEKFRSAEKIKNIIAHGYTVSVKGQNKEAKMKAKEEYGLTLKEANYRAGRLKGTLFALNIIKDFLEGTKKESFRN
jgi:hypothetical protein